MQGEMGIESTLGKGSTFWFTVELEKVEPCSKTETTYSTTNVFRNQSQSRWTNTKVLLVEDDVTNQIVVASMLRKLGCDVDMASDGKKALKALRAVQYNLVFMDIGLPGMDGWKVMQRALEINPESYLNASTPVIATTAHAFTEDRNACLKAGMHDFMTKPVSLQSIKRILHKWAPPDQRADMCTHSRRPDDDALKSEETQTMQAGNRTVPQGIDMKRLMQYVDQDSTLAEEILSSYFKTMPKYLQQLEQSLRKRDYTAIQDQAHMIKGSSAYVGADAIGATASDIIAYAKAKQHNDLSETIRSIRQYFENMKSA
jgi:CheY-like chemotaxis protein/HPt (histidine-containing phosphotransfer) domain-containing protein